jgi:hypothetical protein
MSMLAWTLAAAVASEAPVKPVFVDRSLELGISPAGGHAAWGDVKAVG